jgi:2-polyprenyl-3-methyl-5-hydroxy-6-metoxy-1,4-benzoquinol methylase
VSPPTEAGGAIIGEAMLDEDLQSANERARHAWNQNATFWDDRMGEGNDFVEVLIWPATARLLDLQRDERVLDIACGNGLSSRRLAAQGAKVVAFDFAENMIEHALARTPENEGRIQYLVLDGTDQAGLLALGRREFDAAICNMALFDMAHIKPLVESLAELLRPGGRFVFSVLHPCFNNPHTVHVAEMEDREGQLDTRYSVKVLGYIFSSLSQGVAIPGQPKPQPIFHRPLQVLLGVCFEAGFVLDGLEEPVFPSDHVTDRSPLSWGGNFSQIPPVLVARVRLLA